jgi:hypothetical protein
MFDRFTAIILPMLCKFNREAMEGAFVQAGDKAFHNLSGYKFE